MMLLKYTKNRPSIRRAFYFSIIMLVAGCLLFLKEQGLRLNLTASMPIGLYRLNPLHPVDAIKRGMMVSFCLPQAIAKMGIQRGYLHRGSCPGNVEPLVKRVIAIPGDTILLTIHAINVVGHHTYLAPHQRWDEEGYTVRQWAPLMRYQHADCYWVYGAADYQHSWDSRYYGCISRQAILGICHLLFRL